MKDVMILVVMQLFFIIIGNVFNWSWYAIMIPIWLSLHYVFIATIMYLVINMLLEQYSVKKKK